MKKIIPLILLSVLFTKCNTNQKADIGLQVKNDSLERIINEKDSALYAVIGTFTEIENNLETIKSKERIISSTVQNVENKQNREVKINEDINLIYGLMLENKEKVNQLQEQLKRAHIKNNDLQKTISRLQSKLAEKNAEIIELRRNLLDMNFKIDELTYSLDTLSFNNQVKTAIIEAQEQSLNTGYFLFASAKELKDMEILDKKGGFIGIGAGKSINANFDKSYFNEIDIRIYKSFEFDEAKKIKIISTHPSNSYTIYGEKPVDSLVINDIDEFWSISKYLLIEIN